jgi:UDP-GlcNAc:undecaprenyl-phosphate GlcNAc-1-phosphate transferase
VTAWAVAGVGVAALVITWASTPFAARLARRVGVFDKPGPLKPQAIAIPYFGGLAVAGGLLAGAGIGRSFLLLGAPAAALVLGLVDDIRPTSAFLRLPVEVGIGVGAAFAAGVHSAPGICVAAVFTVVILNAVNFVDGMDGLASAVIVAAAIGCAIVTTGHWAALAAALAGACAGFLPSNRPPARIYLGDAGSYLLGCTLALLLIHIATTHRPVSANVAGLVAVGAYPLLELSSTVIRRLAARRSIFSGDRGHVYDRLRDQGWTVPQTLSALTATQCACVTIGVLVLWQRG